jgi:magnesium transporter
MKEENRDLLSETRDLVEAGAYDDAAAHLEPAHPADQADVVSELDRDRRIGLIRALPREAAARIIEYLTDEPRGEMLEDIDPDELAPLLDEVDDDIVADILHEVPDERASDVLRLMARGSAVAPLLRHADETAGGLMTRAFLQLNQNWTAERAIQYLRRVRPDADSAYYLYITDPAQRLEGIVSLRDLIIAAPSTPLSEIMHRDVHKARDDMDQEEMARLVQRYDLVALPVVDAQDRLVGVITVDDVLDVVEEEATEDILKLAGVGVKETALSPINE